MTLDDMMQFLHVSRPTLFRWVKNKEIPHVRVGKQIFFIKSEITGWLEEKSCPALTAPPPHRRRKLTK